MTADRAALAMAQVDSLEIFGGVVLNRSVGGINPEAVRQMIAFEGGRGKVVWLPTFDAEFNPCRIDPDGDVAERSPSDPFVPLLEAGAPVGPLIKVFALIGAHDLVLTTGHAMPEEVLLLMPPAKAQGDHVVIFTEMVREARVAPLDGRAPLPRRIPQWLGDGAAAGKATLG